MSVYVVFWIEHFFLSTQMTISKEDIPIVKWMAFYWHFSTSKHDNADETHMCQK